MTVTETVSYPPARVHIVADDTKRPARAARRLVTRFGTETVDDSNPVRPLLPDAPERECAYVQATGGDVYLCDSEARARQAAGAGTGTGTGASTSGEGSQTTPAAGAIIAEITGLPAGEYVITASVSETGTTAAVDNNNMALYLNGTLIQQLLYNHSTTIQSAALPMTVTVPADATISVQAIAAATVAAVYTAQIIATPASTATQASAGESAPAPASELGSLLPGGNTAPWPLRGQQAVWIAQAVPGTTCVVSFTADYQ